MSTQLRETEMANERRSLDNHRKQKRPSLASLSLFPNQSRPQPTATRSEPFTSTIVEPLDSFVAVSSEKKKKKSILRFRKSRRSIVSMKSANAGPPENALQWLEACCPKDVVPKVLAFCGPQMVSTLMATNRYWFHLIAHNDSTWRTLCEGMYKVRKRK